MITIVLIGIIVGSFELPRPSKWLNKRATHVFDVHEQDIVCVNSSNKVYKLLRAIEHRNAIATNIDVLEIRQGAADGATFKAVKAILGRAKNVTVLVLRLSFRRFRVFPVFTAFAKLVTLDVNIPHATIAPFLIRHPHIEDLTLGPCGNSRRCPLSRCPLPRLRCLTWSPSCMRALSGSPLTSLTNTHDGVEDKPFPIIKVLDFHLIKLSAILSSLHIDFDHTTTQLLQRISAAAPALQNLKLTESKFSHEVRCSCCSTDHALMQTIPAGRTNVMG